MSNSIRMATWGQVGGAPSDESTPPRKPLTIDFKPGMAPKSLWDTSRAPVKDQSKSTWPAMRTQGRPSNRPSGWKHVPFLSSGHIAAMEDLGRKHARIGRNAPMLGWSEHRFAVAASIASC